MMNVTFKDTDVKATMDYYTKIKEDNQKALLAKFSEMKADQMKLMNSLPKTKAKEKKKAVVGALVTGSTKRTDIKGYIARLKQKIDEILMGDGDRNEKMAKANLLQSKIAVLEKIMAKQIRQETEISVKKKKIKDKVYLTKDDLTLSSDGENDGGESRQPSVEGVGGNIDVSIGAGDAATEIVLESESEVDLEV